MSRDHKFETRMRETYVGKGQVGLMKIAREEHDKVHRLMALLKEINDWMDDAELDSCGTELAFQVGKIIEELGGAYGEGK